MPSTLGAFDRVRIAQLRLQAGALPLTPEPSNRPRVPDLLSCWFDRGSEVFRVVFKDLLGVDVPLRKLALVGQSRTVIGWCVDGSRRGVEVTFGDGEGTSFSAEFARAEGDPAYRRWLASRSPDGGDLGARVAQRVRRIREQHGWSVAELARRSEMAAPNIHRVEAGTHVPTTRTLVRLAGALSVPLAHLVQVRPPMVATRPRRPRPRIQGFC